MECCGPVRRGQCGFPGGNALTTVGLLDAVVYGTADQTNPFLIDSLTPGQPQLDEWLFGPEIGSALAWARLPDGGPAFASDQMVLQQPTPGYTNLLDCDGGTLTAQGAIDGVATVCVDLPGGFLPFTASSNALESAYGLVVTNLDGEVIDVVPGGEGNLGYDFSGSPSGTCLVWGMSYDGDLDPASIAAGAPYDSISASGCVAFSAIRSDGTHLLRRAVADGCPRRRRDEVVGCDLCQYPGALRLPQPESRCRLHVPHCRCGGQPAGHDFGSRVRLRFPRLGRLRGVRIQPPRPQFCIRRVGSAVTGVVADSCGSLSGEPLEVSILACDPSGLCTDLFFSEYVDGSSFAKGLEIYNPSATTAANLGEYAVKTYNNGSNVPNHEVQLSGSLGPGEVYTIVNPTAPAELAQLADLLDDVTLYNGNDATVLERNGVVVDALGVVGVNPGEAWPVNDVTMLHHTLVRNPDVTAGSETGTSCKPSGQITRKTPSNSLETTRPFRAASTPMPSRRWASASRTSWHSKAMSLRWNSPWTCPSRTSTSRCRSWPSTATPWRTSAPCFPEPDLPWCSAHSPSPWALSATSSRKASRPLRWC